MRFKKIYIEITNTCNLNCSFCIKNKRKPKVMNLEEFKIILDKIKNNKKVEELCKHCNFIGR